MMKKLKGEMSQELARLFFIGLKYILIVTVPLFILIIFWGKAVLVIISMVASFMLFAGFCAFVGSIIDYGREE